MKLKNLINSLDKSKKFDIENIILGMNPYFENLDKMIDKSYEKSLEYHEILNKMESIFDIFIRFKQLSLKAKSLQSLPIDNKDPFDIFS